MVRPLDPGEGEVWASVARVVVGVVLAAKLEGGQYMMLGPREPLRCRE